MVTNGCARGSALSNDPVLFQNQCSGSQPLDAFFLSGSTAPFVAGTRSMLSFEEVRPCNGSARSLGRSYDADDNGDEELDEYFHQPGKKRRLTVDQVQFLEKSFEVENKLEPERKVQLAKDLGLQPRQVAIWFQNRRARWKAKQLEKDYEDLLGSYNSLKTRCDVLIEDNQKLKEKVNTLNKLLAAGDIDPPPTIYSGSEDDDKLSIELPKTSPMDSGSEVDVSKASFHGVFKQEDISSGKSDIFDSDSPRYTGGVQSFLETGDSSYAFEQDQSDLSQDEDDNINKGLFNVSCVFSKVEDVGCSVPSSDFEDPALWSWSY